MPDSKFTLKKGSRAITLAGVGLLDENHDITLARAAQAMNELQDDDGRPLTGSELVSAAEAWAKRVGAGIEVSSDNPPSAPFPVLPAADKKE